LKLADLPGRSSERITERRFQPAFALRAPARQPRSGFLLRANIWLACRVEARSAEQSEDWRPPRDLQSWQQFPVSAIANFRPVIIRDLVPAKLQDVLKVHPYQRFPVVQGDKLTGILTRREAEAALRENRAPKLENATTCLPHQTVRKLQGLLVESPINFVVLVDDDGGKILGIVTLHDLLRAEVEKAGSSDT
jgi:CBS domain-containing protein